MQSTASLDVLLLLSTCARNPNAPALAEPPPPLRTWLGQDSRADLLQAAGPSPRSPLSRARATRIEAGAASAADPAGHPSRRSLFPHASLLYEGNQEAGRLLATHVADAKAGLVVLRQAIPGTDADRVAGEQRHSRASRPEPPDRRGCRRRDAAGPMRPQTTAATPIVLAKIERLRRGDLAQTERRQRILLSAIVNVAPSRPRQPETRP